MILKPQKVSLPQVSETKTEYPEKEIELNREIDLIKPGKSVSLVPDPDLHLNNLPVSDKNPALEKKPEKNQKPASESNLPVTYTGKELIRRKIIPKGAQKFDLVTIIRGKAVLKQGEMKMRSHEIKLFGKENDVAVSNYPVKINDYKSNTEITAGYGRFTKVDNKVFFTKKPVLTHIDSVNGDKTIIRGDQMFHFFVDGISVVYGHVIINNPRGVAYAKKAIFYKDDDRIELEGNPRLYEKNHIYQADSMVLYRKEKRALLNGHSRVLILEENNEMEAGNKNNGTIDTLILSDLAEYNYGLKPVITKFKTSKSNSFVYISRKDSDTYCRRADARGNSPDEIDLYDDIYVLDRENRTRLYGQYSEYRKNDNRLWVYTRKNAKGEDIHPEVYFYNKEDELTGKMEGEIFERLLEDKKTFARGDVNFKLYEKKSSPQDSDKIKNEIIGQWAESEDSKKEVYIYGKPYIKQEENNIYAGKIIVYPDENRLDLLHSIEGNF